MRQKRTRGKTELTQSSLSADGDLGPEAATLAGSTDEYGGKPAAPNAPTMRDGARGGSAFSGRRAPRPTPFGAGALILSPPEVVPPRTGTLGATLLMAPRPRSGLVAKVDGLNSDDEVGKAVEADEDGMEMDGAKEEEGAEG